MKRLAPILVMLLLCGTTAMSENKLTANPTTLSFAGVTVSPSPSQSYVLYWANNGGSITIAVTPSANAQVSTDNVTFSSTVINVVVPARTNVPVYVRIVASDPIVLNQTIANIGTVDLNQSAPVTITGDVPLPITLSSFKLNLSSDTPILNWSTLSEIENYGFYVQKSQDNVVWTDIMDSFQKGYGTTVEPHFYSYADITLPVGNYYRLHQVDLDGTSHFSEAISVVASAEPVTLVKEFALNQSYPNPFNPKAVVSSQLPAASHVRLTIYDALGREVTLLVDEQRAAGVYRDTFDGSGLASGVYYYRLTAGSYTDTKKMVLMK